MSSADAVARETAWLASYSQADGLPGLLTQWGGPFDVVQAYRPRTPATRKNQLYVTRGRIRVTKFGFNRLMNTYPFILELYWPLSSGTGTAENDQQAFDDAVELLLQRISGPVLAFPLDKTHGGRFLTVAQDPTQTDVDFADPEQSIAAGVFSATVTYSADDKDYTG